MNNLKNRVAKLEARNAQHDKGIVELFEMFCELEGHVLPDNLPTEAEVIAIIRSAIGSALRPVLRENDALGDS